MYISIDRKPENGCEIQNAACGQSGIINTAEDGVTHFHETSTRTMQVVTMAQW